MTEHVDEPCENPTCWSCNPEHRPRCGPCRKVMTALERAFVCPSCGAGVNLLGQLR